MRSVANKSCGSGMSVVDSKNSPFLTKVNLMDRAIRRTVLWNLLFVTWLNELAMSKKPTKTARHTLLENGQFNRAMTVLITLVSSFGDDGHGHARAVGRHAHHRRVRQNIHIRQPAISRLSQAENTARSASGFHWLRKATPRPPRSK